MRIKTLLLGLMLLCGFTMVPLAAQDDDTAEGDVVELSSSESLSVNDETPQSADELAASAEAAGQIDIIVYGRYLGRRKVGNVIIIYCAPANTVCVRIRIRPVPVSPISPTPLP